MTRFEKIIAEQQTRKSKLGDWGIYTGNWNSIAPDLKNNGKKLVDDKSIDVVSFLWWIISENSDFQTIASNLYKSIQFGKNSQFNTGKYIYVIGEKITGKKSKGKPIEFWPVYIVPVTTLEITKSTYNIGKSPVVTIERYETLLKKQNALTISQKKVDAEAPAAAKKKPTIEKPEVVVQNVIKGTETIDTNNLGKGTPDAKAFQELLWQYGNKYETQKELPVYTKFAEYRTQGADGGWDGKIGPATKNYITFLYAGLKVNTYAELIKKIRSDLSQVQTESTNYFKGIGMNIKFKDILREQLLKEQEGFDFSAANAAIGSGASGNTSATKKKAAKKAAAKKAADKKAAPDADARLDKIVKANAIVYEAWQDMYNIFTKNPDKYFGKFSSWYNDSEYAAAKWLHNAFLNGWLKNEKNPDKSLYKIRDEMIKDGSTDAQKVVDNINKLIRIYKFISELIEEGRQGYISGGNQQFSYYNTIDKRWYYKTPFKFKWYYM